jgi:hypothetical protein
MADRPLVLSAALCFLLSKYGKVQLTTLKSVLRDFYNADDLDTAKVQLLHDLESLNLPDKPPHTSRRRDGNNRIAYEVDDMFALITFADEHKLFDKLPIYVTNNVDCLPSLHVTEGDLRFLLSRLDKLDERLDGLHTSSSNMAADILAIRRSVVDITSKQVIAIGSTAAATIGNSIGNSMPSVPSVPSTAAEATNRLYTTTIAHNLPYPGIKPTTQSWAAAVAAASTTPVSSGNHAAPPSQLLPAKAVQSNSLFVVKSTHETDHETDHSVNDGTNSDFQLYESHSARRHRLKRQRQHTDEEAAMQSQQQQLQQQQQRHQVPHSARKPLIIGKRISFHGDNGCGNLPPSATNVSRIFGVRPVFNRTRKTVFCIDNVHCSISREDMFSFLQDLSVDVISLFEVKSRRRRNDTNYLQRKAFRLCIDERQVDKLLDENRWPADIAISYWFFKGDGATNQPGHTATAGTLQSAQSGQSSHHSSSPVVGGGSVTNTVPCTSVCKVPADVIDEIKSTRDDGDDAASSHMDTRSSDADDTIILNSSVIDNVIARDNSAVNQSCV